jgi:hypothetical protein
MSNIDSLIELMELTFEQARNNAIILNNLQKDINLIKKAMCLHEIPNNTPMQGVPSDYKEIQWDKRADDMPEDLFKKMK